MVAQKDDEFHNALQSSDILLPDGIGIVAAVSMLNNIKIKRITGFDAHYRLLKTLNFIGGKVFYMGSSNQTLKKIKKRINEEYPNIEFESYSPPFKEKFSTLENNIILTALNESKPDLLFVGMTAPKQEKWVYENKDKINAKVICSIGAVFDFYSGNIKRPGKFWIKFGLEGMIRIVKEPKRLWKRFIFSDLPFMFFIFKNWLNKKLTRKHVTI